MLQKKRLWGEDPVNNTANTGKEALGESTVNGHLTGSKGGREKQ